VDTRLVRCDWAGPEGWLLACDAKAAISLRELLVSAGFEHRDSSTWEQARIEAGTPRLCDLLPKTLPQELGRDARAISFTKGCYLGQETVARLDALGHVNRRLVGLAIDGDTVPAPGAGINLGSDTVGHVTSCCFSPTLSRPLALAILPVKLLAADTPLTVEGRPASPVHFPLS
jgi:folate-binding protein YgfZ